LVVRLIASSVIFLTTVAQTSGSTTTRSPQHSHAMSPAEAAQHIAELRTEVARHDELYPRRSTPEIVDFDYDRLKAELAALEKQFPSAAAALGAGPPTARVGDDRTEGFMRVKHQQAMTARDNACDQGAFSRSTVAMQDRR
jgi:NAD-dependent DNA ligase